MEYGDRTVAKNAVLNVLGMREEIRAGLQPIYERKLNNEPMQEELNEFFNDYQHLYELVGLIDNFGLDTITSELLEESDDITEDHVSDIQYFWESINWIRPAYQAYEQQREGYNYWTETDLDYELPAGLTQDFVVIHKADHGLDELWEVHAPLDEFILELGRDVRRLSECIQQARQEAPGTVVSSDQKESLQNLLDQFTQVSTELQKEIDSLSPYGETGLDVTFDDLLTSDADQIVAQIEEGE